MTVSNIMEIYIGLKRVNKNEFENTPKPDSGRVVTYKPKYVHEVLVYSLVKLVQKKSVVR